MIDQEKFHDPFPRLGNHLGFRIDVHTGRNVCGATDDWLGNPSDFRGTVFLKDCLASPAIPHGGAHLDKAHPAITGDT